MWKSMLRICGFRAIYYNRGADGSDPLNSWDEIMTEPKVIFFTRRMRDLEFKWTHHVVSSWSTKRFNSVKKRKGLFFSFLALFMCSWPNSSEHQKAIRSKRHETVGKLGEKFLSVKDSNSSLNISRSDVKTAEIKWNKIYVEFYIVCVCAHAVHMVIYWLYKCTKMHRQNVEKQLRVTRNTCWCLRLI